MRKRFTIWWGAVTRRGGASTRIGQKTVCLVYATCTASDNPQCRRRIRAVPHIGTIVTAQSALRGAPLVRAQTPGLQRWFSMPPVSSQTRKSIRLSPLRPAPRRRLSHTRPPSSGNNSRLRRARGACSESAQPAEHRRRSASDRRGGLPFGECAPH